MPMLMIRCPNTGKPLPTGIAMPKRALASASLIDKFLTCPHCGKVHIWDKEDAFFEEEEPGDDRKE